MDFEAYTAARQGMRAFGLPLSLIFVIVAAGLTATSFYPIWKWFLRRSPLSDSQMAGVRQIRRVFSIIALILLLIGFMVLVWFHLIIYRSFALIDPSNLQIAGRFAIPFWIDTEKIYFWTLLISIFVFWINCRQPRFASLANLALSFFLILTVFTSNPFLQPLPLFHQEITNYIQNLTHGDIYDQLAVFRSVYGRLRFYYNTTYMWTHPPLLFVSYAAFVLSFLAFLAMLFRHDHFFEQVAYDYTKFGYIFLTFGMLIGYPWAIMAWKNDPWWWSPKINISLVMWVLYTAYLHSRLYLKRRGMWTATAIIGIFSFLSLVFNYVTTYLIPGVHSYG